MKFHELMLSIVLVSVVGFIMYSWGHANAMSDAKAECIQMVYTKAEHEVNELEKVSNIGRNMEQSILMEGQIKLFSPKPSPIPTPKKESL